MWSADRHPNLKRPRAQNSSDRRDAQRVKSISAQPYDPPFGVLEDRELERLSALGAGSRDIALAIALRARQFRPGHWTTDSVEFLANRAGHSTATATRSLKWLTNAGLLEVGQEVAIKGGRQGRAWVVERRVRPFAEWPGPEDLTMVIDSAGQEDVIDASRGPHAQEQRQSTGGTYQTSLNDSNRESRPTREALDSAAAATREFFDAGGGEPQHKGLLMRALAQRIQNGADPIKVIETAQLAGQKGLPARQLADVAARD